MAGWHHCLDGHGFGWTPGVCDGQGGLACCNSWGHKESDTTEQLTELKNSLNTIILIITVIYWRPYKASLQTKLVEVMEFQLSYFKY